MTTCGFYARRKCKLIAGPHTPGVPVRNSVVFFWVLVKLRTRCSYQRRDTALRRCWRRLRASARGHGRLTPMPQVPEVWLNITALVVTRAVSVVADSGAISRRRTRQHALGVSFHPRIGRGVRGQGHLHRRPPNASGLRPDKAIGIARAVGVVPMAVP